MIEDYNVSRSFKKTPCICDNDRSGSAKKSKDFAASKQRHYKDLPNGGAYKKVFEQYNIHDYKFHIWRRDDLINWRNKFGVQEKWPCFKDLCKTKMFREARSK